MLLDLRLPDIDGYAVARELRARSRVPIIMVTAKGEEVDRVIGLELGADDYVVKPFGMRELVARINAVMRRVSENGTPPEPDPVRWSARWRSTGAGTRFAWTAARSRSPRRSSHCWRCWPPTRAPRSTGGASSRTSGAPAGTGPSKTIDVHVSSLRRKLGDPGWIETVRGIGFRLRPP